MEILPSDVDDLDDQKTTLALEICRRAMSTPNTSVLLHAGVLNCENGGYHAVFRVDETTLWTHIHWPNFQEAESFQREVFEDVTYCMNESAIPSTVIHNN